MKYIKYFFQFLLATICFIIFKILGASISSKISGKIFEFIGPFFRSEEIINSNIKRAIPNIQPDEIKNLCGIIMEEFLLNICLLKILG